MNTLSVGYGSLVVFLVKVLVIAVLVIVIVTVIGIPVPASEAGEGWGGASGQHPLTINGQPLSRLLDPTLTTTDRIGDAWQVPRAALLARESAREFAESELGQTASGVLRCDRRRRCGRSHCRSNSPRGGIPSRILRGRGLREQLSGGS